MKLKPKKLAALLLLLTRGKDEAEARAAIRDFLVWLQRRKHFKLAGQAAKHFEDLVRGEQGIVAAELAMREEPDAGTLELVREFVCERVRADRCEVKTSVDPSLIGGAVVRWGDKVIDGSFRARIRELNKAMKG